MHTDGDREMCDCWQYRHNDCSSLQHHGGEPTPRCCGWSPPIEVSRMLFEIAALIHQAPALVAELEFEQQQ